MSKVDLICSCGARMIFDGDDGKNLIDEFNSRHEPCRLAKLAPVKPPSDDNGAVAGERISTPSARMSLGFKPPSTDPWKWGSR